MSQTVLRFSPQNGLDENIQLYMKQDLKGFVGKAIDCLVSP